MPSSLLAGAGGPFDMARLVDLGKTRPAPKPPHVEDHVFLPDRAKVAASLVGGEFWSLLCAVAKATLREIFGDALHRLGDQSLGTDDGKGLASIGCLRLARAPKLYLRTCAGRKAQVRMRFGDGQLEADASVTDLRLFGADHATPDRAALQRTAALLDESRGVILGVGLTRRFRSRDDQPYAHWLQVNAIHLRENPVCRLGLPT